MRGQDHVCIGGGASARDWPNRPLLPSRLPGYKAPQSLSLRPWRTLRLRRRNPSSLPGKELYRRGEGAGPLCKAQEQLGPPRNPSPVAARSTKSKTLAPGRPKALLGSTVLNLECLRSPLRARGATFCPLPRMPWRKGRGDPSGERKEEWERLRSRPGQSFRNTDCGSNRTRFHRAPGPAQSPPRFPNTPPRLEGGAGRRMPPPCHT